MSIPQIELTTRIKLHLSKDFQEALGLIKPAARAKIAPMLNALRIGKLDGLVEFGGASDYMAADVSSPEMPLLALVRLFCEGETLYVLVVRIAHPDEARRWADAWQCECNPVTRRVDVYLANDTGLTIADDDASEAAEETDDKPCVTALLTRDELIRLGVPEGRLGLLEGVADEAALARVREGLPEPTFEALLWIVQGESKEAVLEAYARETPPEGEVRLPPGEIVTDDAALQAMVDKPLDVWRVFLHPTQRELVERPWRGAVRVTGGAGTGKTVAALHRCAHLLRLPDWEATDKLLLTTFTRNLAADLESQLKSLLTPEEMKRVEVMNIDRLVNKRIRLTGLGKTVVYPGSDAYRRAWKLAMATTPDIEGEDEDFLLSEFEHVVVRDALKTQADYMLAPRTGRGRRLSRLQRKTFWGLFANMRAILEADEHILLEDAAAYLIDELKAGRAGSSYRAIVADEIQDFKPELLRLMRALTPDRRHYEEKVEGDLFMVGDAHQRIYGAPVTFSACGIEIRGRAKRLRVNYRTTDEIRRCADGIYVGRSLDDMNGGKEEKIGYASLRHGPAPEVLRFEGDEKEKRALVAIVKELTERARSRTGEPYRANEICVVAHTIDALEGYEKALCAAGIAVHQVKRDEADDGSAEGVRLATMHRVKGLEFKVVLMCGLAADRYPPAKAASLEGVEKREQEARYAALLYVAATRAIDRLYILSPGDVTPMLNLKS